MTLVGPLPGLVWKPLQQAHAGGEVETVPGVFRLSGEGAPELELFLRDDGEYEVTVVGELQTLAVGTVDWVNLKVASFLPCRERAPAPSPEVIELDAAWRAWEAVSHYSNKPAKAEAAHRLGEARRALGLKGAA